VVLKQKLSQYCSIGMCCFLAISCATLLSMERKSAVVSDRVTGCSKLSLITRKVASFWGQVASANLMAYSKTRLGRQHVCNQHICKNSGH
jgi:hypothetical protein